jgi:hypothetical protein
VVVLFHFVVFVFFGLRGRVGGLVFFYTIVVGGGPPHFDG